MTRSVYPIVILAGGLATRLRPLTDTIPKSLIDINGEPFIAHQLRLLKCSGLLQVVICAGHLGEMIAEYVGDGSRFGLQVRYSFDGSELLGTGGALRKASALLRDRFQVIYGDSYLMCDYPAVQSTFDRSGRKAMMTVYRNNGRFDSSNVEFSNGEIVAYNKRHRTRRMQHIDYGLGVLDPTALDLIPEGRPSDLAELYAQLLAQRQLAAYEVRNRFYEIGSITGIQEMRRHLEQESKQA